MALASVGRFGEGRTHGRPVSSNQSGRCQPRMGTTCNDEPITILLVDDDEDCRSLIRDAISECKVSNEIHEARNGRTAPHLARVMLWLGWPATLGANPKFPLMSL